MIGTSTAELYFIRFCIICLHYLAPLCILYCVFVIGVYGFKAARYPVPFVIECVALAESLFYLLVYLPYRAHLQREAVHPPTLSRAERDKLFELCIENILDAEAYLRTWFMGASPEDIRRENVKDFFLWAFFNRGGPPGDDDEELEVCIGKLEELLGRKIEPGRGIARPLRLTLDRVPTMHRSLTWYCVVGFVDFITYMNLLRKGFEFYRTPFSSFFTLFPFRPQTLFTTKISPVSNLTYWHREHTSKTRLPVVFVHGIGIGLYPYVNFLGDLNSTEGLEGNNPDDQVGIIAIEIMPISFRITKPPLSKNAMCAEIAAILTHHGWDKVVLVTHSYGSVVTTHLLKTPSTATLIGPVVLIDPVSILLHLPDVAYNFTRRKPRRANEHQLYYFASMDVCVSHTLARYFFWSENILWKDDVKGRNVTVSLSGKDLIVDTEAVGWYLISKNNLSHRASTVLIDVDDAQNKGYTGLLELARGIDGYIERPAESWKERAWVGKGIDILWFADCDHSQVFDKPATRRPLVSTIRAYCTQAQGEEVEAV